MKPTSFSEEQRGKTWSHSNHKTRMQGLMVFIEEWNTVEAIAEVKWKNWICLWSHTHTPTVSAHTGDAWSLKELSVDSFTCHHLLLLLLLLFIALITWEEKTETYKLNVDGMDVNWISVSNHVNQQGAHKTRIMEKTHTCQSFSLLTEFFLFLSFMFFSYFFFKWVTDSKRKIMQVENSCILPWPLLKRHHGTHPEYIHTPELIVHHTHYFDSYTQNPTETNTLKHSSIKGRNSPQLMINIYKL